MRDPPVTIDLSQSDRQAGTESAWLRRADGRAGAAPHDGHGEGDIFAGRNCELLDVERL
jgi:hypothetical protein